jgi:hypothetical protein
MLYPFDLGFVNIDESEKKPRLDYHNVKKLSRSFSAEKDLGQEMKVLSQFPFTIDS